ncbi:MAG TPA: DinB family protein [Ktedonobacteraceae bacterium]|nr:DinB family protein [Ktedonobacteraceae bacterium]
MATVENPFDKVRRKMVAARLEFIGQLAKFSSEELARNPAGEDEWTPLQLAHHLYIADGLALETMQQVQSEDNPLIVDLGEETPRRTRAAGQPTSLDAVLGGMAARREELFQYLSELPDDAWERPLRYSTYGQLKFYQVVNIVAAHEKMHAQQLADIRAAAGTKG